ncbi:hypothetical protein F8388_020303 [Cannabis sativa]|uniref:Uncharacterized protein n=1 Tax=Cannabis sativa TaxID=3483 RepID=A0A7J6FVX3_CANSA|nr:hypothetical protein F8388_020303 [Cannabis sativa]
MGSGSGSVVIVRSEMEAVQTVPPLEITAPRKVRQIVMSSAAGAMGEYVWGWGGCVHTVLYYNKKPLAEEEEDSGSLHAGWIKESLAIALSQQPLFSGRLQKLDDVNYGIVANDAGVRLIEARLPVTMSEFLLHLDRACGSTRREAEAQLVFWKDVDQTDPQFYVISSSASQDNSADDQTIIFNVKYSNEDNPPITDNTLALLCVEKAETKLGTKMALEYFSFSYVKESNNDNNMMMKLEKCSSKYDLATNKKNLSFKDQVASWDDFGTNELEFRKGNLPLRVSNWIGSVSKGFIMTIPYYFDNHENVSGLKVIVKMDSINK